MYPMPYIEKQNVAETVLFSFNVIYKKKKKKESNNYKPTKFLLIVSEDFTELNNGVSFTWKGEKKTQSQIRNDLSTREIFISQVDPPLLRK